MGAAPVGRRREARERAIGLLYEIEAKGSDAETVLGELPVPPDPYVTDVVGGIGRRGGEVDGLISRFAIDWNLPRMPAIDRAVLRLATYELIARPDVPTSVVISEAVELAKQYSTDESGRFVNGVLASISGHARGL